MVGSRVGQTHARMQPMTSLLRRAFSRLLESTPNYVEVTAVLAVALIARLLYQPDIWKASPQPCVVVALFVACPSMPASIEGAFSPISGGWLNRPDLSFGSTL